MPMNASTSGSSFGKTSRNRCGRQPETMMPCPRFVASRSSADSRMVSTLSSCAESMNEQVFTITTSAWRASFVISTPSFRSVPIMISASTRFFAHPSEIKPTRTGRSVESGFIKDRSPYVIGITGATAGSFSQHSLREPRPNLPRRAWLAGPTLAAGQRNCRLRRDDFVRHQFVPLFAQGRRRVTALRSTAGPSESPREPDRQSNDPSALSI